jgi:hypothetical protein
VGGSEEADNPVDMGRDLRPADAETAEPVELGLSETEAAVGVSVVRLVEPVAPAVAVGIAPWEWVEAA